MDNLWIIYESGWWIYRLSNQLIVAQIVVPPLSRSVEWSSMVCGCLRQRWLNCRKRVWSQNGPSASGTVGLELGNHGKTMGKP